MLTSYRMHAAGRICGLQVAANYHVEAKSREEAVQTLRAKLWREGWTSVKPRFIAPNGDHLELAQIDN